MRRIENFLPQKRICNTHHSRSRYHQFMPDYGKPKY